jgi:hypothetical protein
LVSRSKNAAQIGWRLIYRVPSTISSTTMITPITTMATVFPWLFFSGARYTAWVPPSAAAGRLAEWDV